MGVGAARRFDNLRWELVERILWTWALTLPASAIMGYAVMRLAMTLGGG